MHPLRPESRRFTIHGLPVAVDCSIPAIARYTHDLLADFSAEHPRAVPQTTVGRIDTYELNAVLPHLSPKAIPLPGQGDLGELYQEQETFYLLDERWGLTRINLLKAQWHSWVLANCPLDLPELLDHVLFWPLAQLLRRKGLYLLPAVAAVRDGWAVLIVSPFGIEPELLAMVRAGYRIIGQRWTALRAAGDRPTLLHLPGQLSRQRLMGIADCRLPIANWQTETGAGVRNRQLAIGNRQCFVDLTAEYCGTRQSHAQCNAVAIVEPGRRPRAQFTSLPASQALELLRQRWPIPELHPHPHRRPSPLAADLARQCRCGVMRLSDRPQEFLMLLDALRRPYATRASRAASRLLELLTKPNEPVTT